MKKSAIFSLIAFILAFAFILANTTEAQAKYKKWEYFGKRCPSCYKKAIYKCMNCRKQDRSIHNWEAPICKSCLEKRKCIECKKD